MVRIEFLFRHLTARVRTSGRLLVFAGRLLVLGGLALVQFGAQAQAAALTFNGGNGTLSPSDSSGAWNYSATNWWAPGSSSWSDGSDAVFGAGAGNGAAGTVTIGSGLTLSPNSITFAPTGNGGAYTVTGGSISVTAITVNNNATISSPLVGAGGLTVSGNSVLTLGAVATYTGPTVVSGGTLHMASTAALPTNIAAQYSFQGNANDSSSNGLNATAQGGAGYIATPFGQAISLNGTSQYATVPYNAALNITGAYTVSIWVNTAGTANTGPALVSTRNGGDDTFDLQYNASTGALHGDIGNGGAWLNTTANYTLPSPFAVGTWNMVTYAVNTSGYTIYVNGASKAAVAFTGTPTPELMKAGQTLSFGSQQASTNAGAAYGSGGWFNGSLADATIYNSALSAAQISALYTGEAATLSVATTLSVSAGAAWDLNSTTQTVAGLAGAGNVTLGSGGGLIINSVSPSASTFSGVISDSGVGSNIALTGPATLTFAGANTYKGFTAVNAGVLDLSNSLAVQNSTLKVNSGGTLVFDSSVASHAFTIGGLGGNGNLALQDNAGSPDPVALTVGGNGGSTTYSGNLSGSGPLNKIGAGTLTLSGSNTYSGTITISAGSLSLGSLNALPQAGNITFAGGTLVYSAASIPDYSANIVNSSAPIAINTNGHSITFNTALASSNSGGLTVSGAGTLLLTSTNTYPGPTIISGGALQLVGPTLPLLNGSFATPALAANSYTYFTSLSAAQQAALVWTSSGNGGTGGAMINSSTAWGYTMPYPVGNQAFSLQATSYIGESVALTPGTYQITWSQEGRPGNAANPLYFEINGGTQAFYNNTTTGTWATASDTFVIATSGTYTLGFLGTGAGGANGEALNNIIVSSAGNNLLPTLTAVNLTASAADFNIGLSTQTIGSLTGVAGASVVDNGTLISGNDNTNATFAGAISGGGSLTKIGTGLMYLGGASTYTGPTTVSSGTLTVGPAGSLATSAASVSNGAVLNVAGSLASTTNLIANGTVNFTSAADTIGALTDSGAGTRSVTLSNTVLGVTGTSTFSGSVSGAGTLKVTAGGLLTLTGNNASSVATTVDSGTLLLSNAGTNNIAASSPVTVNSAGTLNVSGLAGGGITVASGQTLRGTGTVLGAVTAGAGSTVLSGTGNAGGSGIGTLALNGNLSLNSGASLAYYLGTPGTASASLGNAGLINIQGNLTLPASGLNLVLNNNSNLGGLGSAGNGYYELATYTGSLIGTPSNAFAVPQGKIYQFYNLTSNQLDIYVAITAFNWTGVNSDGVTANSSWDTLGSTNWANLGLSSTTAASYQNGSNVTFGDANALTGSAVGTSNVVIQAAGVQPNSVVFNNNTVNYTVNNSSGTAGIAGATGITVSGTGTVSLQSPNSFQGLVAVNSGILNISNSAALGTSAGVSVASGGALQIQGGLAIGAIPLSLSGAGFTASPAGALDSLSGTNSYAGAVTLSGPSTIAVTTGQLTLSGAVGNGGNLLTIGGAGATTLSGPGISGTGGLSINSGATLNLSGSMSSASNLIANGSVNFTAASQTAATLNDSGLGTGSVTFNNTALTIGGPSNYSGSISGGSLTLASGVLTLSGISSLPTVNVNGATLNVTGGSVVVQTAFNPTTGSNTINLSGGVLQTPAWASGASGASTIVNFNGGTLQANASSTNFLGFTPVASLSLNVYTGGAVIDTQGNNLTISQPIAGAANSGISSVAFTGTSAVYTTPPAVTISGGGSGGAAYATLNSSGHVNGIVVTSPGSYTAPPSMSVGGSTLNLTPTLTPNSNGGLTKYGAGTLTMASTSTYSGPTVVQAGTLQLGNGPLTSFPGGGLAALYPLNGNANDISGNNNNGAFVGTPTAAPGRYGTATAFNGVNQGVTVPYSATLQTNAYTVSFWENVNSYTNVANPTFFSTRSGGDEVDLQMTSTGGLHGDIGAGGTTWLTTIANAPSVVLGLNTWNMVTMSVSNSSYSYYVNGSPVVSNAAFTTAGTPLFMNSSLTIGEAGAGTYVSGAMQYFDVFSTVLTPAQVLSLYQGQQAGVLPAASALTIASGATFDLSGYNQTMASLSGGTGAVVTNSTATGPNTLTLAPGPVTSNTFSGTLQNGAGTLSLALNGQFGAVEVLSGVNTFSGNVTIAQYNTLDLANSGALLAVTLSSSGTVFDKSVTSHAFTLGGLSGNFNLGLSDNAATPNAVALSVGNNNQNTSYYGSITNGSASGGSLIKVGSGILSLFGPSTYTGGTFINGGELSLNYFNAILPAGNITFGGGALQYTANNTNDYSANIVNSTGPVTIDTNGQAVTFGSPLASSNSGGFATIGAGTLTFAASNAYQGATYIAGGTLSLANIAAIPAGSVITFGPAPFAGGTLQYTASNTVDYSGQIANSTAPIAIDTNGLNLSFNSALSASNSGGLTKIGAGTLVLNVSNAYSGTTTVAGGVLQLQNRQGVPDNTSLAVSGGTFDLNGYSKSLSVISASALSGGLITSTAAGTPVTLNLAVVPSTALESIVGTTLSDGAGTMALAVTSTNGSGLQITSTNAFSGGTNINNSYVRLGDASALGTGAITITNSGFVELWYNTGSGTAGTSVTLANNFVLDTLGGAQFGSQPPKLKTAIFADGNIGNSTAGSPITYLTGSVTLTANGGAIDGYPANGIIVTGLISGAGGLFKGMANEGNGGDVVTLTNTSNSYQGGTTIYDGTLAITADAVLGPNNNITFLGNGALGAAGSNVVLSANRQITISTPAGTLNSENYTMTVNSVIGGTGGLTITGGTSGVLILNAANTYGGATNINGGTLNLNNNLAAIPLTSNISFGGGVLQFTPSNTYDYSGQIGSSTGAIAIDTNGQNVTFNSSLVSSNSGGLNKLGAGTLFLNGFNSYSGTTIVSGGTLSLNNQFAIPATSQTVTFRGGTLQYTASNTTDFSSIIKNSTGPIAIDTNSQNVTFNNTLDSSNTAGFTKIGAGTLVVANINTYSGPTVIQGGTVQLQGQTAVNAPVSTQQFTSDASSGIASNAYTVAVALNQTGTLNINGGIFTGVPYPGATVAAGGAGPFGSSWSLSTSAGGVAGNNSSGNFVNGFQPAAGQQTHTMLSDFFYEGSAVPVTLTLSGLVPGDSYDARIYYRAFGALDNRTADFTFNNGASTQTLTAVNEDANSTGNYIDYQYTASSAGTAQISETNDLTMLAGGSWHWYAFSNQLLPTTGNLLPTSTPVSIVAGSTLDLNGVNQQVGSLNGAGMLINSNLALPSTLTVGDPSNQNSFFTGTITDAGAAALSIATSGSGTFNLAGTASIQGPFNVNSGNLQVNGAVTASVLYVNNAAQLSGSGTIQTTGDSLYYNSSAASTFAGAIVGTQFLEVEAGKLTLTGTGNSYFSTQVTGGVLKAGAVNALSDAALNITGGTLDATGYSQTVSSLTVFGALNLTIGNAYTLNNTGLATLGGTLNLYAGSAGSADLINYTSFSGTFADVTGIPPGYLLAYNSNQLDLLLNESSWTAGSGNWSNNANWTNNSPNGPGAVAGLNQPSGAVAITLDVPVTLGTLNIGATGSSASYALSGNTLTFNNSGYPAAVTVLGGTHSIASAVFLQGGNLDLTVSNHGDLKISGNISDDGGSRALVLLGDGTGELVLSGNNTYTGGTSVVGGTLVAASATALPNGSSLTVGQGASSLFAPSFAGPAVEAAPAGVAAVPEPGTLMLLLAALCGAVTCYRFSARSKAVQVG